MNELRSALQALMKERGLSQVDVFEATGVPQSSLSLFLSGKRSGINGEGTLRLTKFIAVQGSSPPVQDTPTPEAHP